MREKPDIVKMLKEEEKLGKLQGRAQNKYEKLELSEESFENVPGETIGFAEDDDMKKRETVGDTAGYDKLNEKQRESEEKFRILPEQNMLGVIIIQDGLVKYVNQAACEITEYSHEEALNWMPGGFSKLFHPDDLEFVMKQAQKKQKGEKDVVTHYSYRIVTKSGKVIWIDQYSKTMSFKGKNADFITILDITERKQAEEKIRYLKEYNENILESNPNSIIVIKGNQIEYVNNSFISTFGKNKDDYISKELKEVLPVAVIPAFVELLQDHDKIKELKIKDKIFSVSSFIVKKAEEEEEEERRGIILQDITECKKAINEIEKAKHELEAKNQELENTINYANRISLETKNALTELDQIFNSTDNGMLVIDKDSHILKMNDTFSTMFGISKAEVVGRKCYEVLNEPLCHSKLCPLKKMIDGAERVEFETEIEHTNGTKIPCNLTATSFKRVDGEIIGVIENFKDITERRKAEETLKESEEKFRTFVDTASDLMSISDKDGKFTDVNEEMTRILGYAKEEMIGMRIAQILTKESLENDFKPNWGKFKKEGKISIETTFAAKDGKEIYGELKTVAIRDSDGNNVGGRSVFHDLTERKQAEEKIKQQNTELEKLNELKSMFLNITSHELRTPMSSIKGYIQMLLRRTFGEINDEQKSALEVILRNTNRLDALIQDILDISRIESGTMKFIPEKINLQKMLNEIAETMTSSAGLKEIELNTDIKKGLPDLFIDQERIKQVIINLLNNAIKFSPDGSAINIRAKKEQNSILFEIQDFGRGIPLGKQEKIFDTFYQVDSSKDTKFGGAGLGLAISQGIAIAHGGKIWVESKGIPGEGSTFRFTLPVKSVKDIESRFKKVDVFRLGEKEE